MHGLSDAAAAIVAAIAPALRQQAQLRGVELAATFDAQSGVMVGSIVSGGATEVDVGPHLRALLPGHSYVALHTHLTSTSFSDADALVLAVNTPLACVIVLGADETWYLLSMLPGATSPSPADVVREFSAFAITLSRRYLDLIRSGELSPPLALREFSHGIWLRAASRLSLRYDRLSED